MQYDKKDVPAFQEEVCRKTCIMKGKCIEDRRDANWFLMCPHYFKWKLKLPKTFIEEQIDWERKHPEEAAKKHQLEIELAKAWRKSKKISETD